MQIVMNHLFIRFTISVFILAPLLLLHSCDGSKGSKGKNADLSLNENTPALALTIGWYLPLDYLQKIVGPDFTPKIAKSDDWPTFSLSTKPATVVDGRGCCCCLLHQKWSRSVSVGHWTASQCCCCYQIWTSSGVSHSSAKSQLVSPSNLCYIQVDLHCTRLLQLSGSITASGFEMVVNGHQRQCKIGQWSTWLTSSLSKQQMMSET